MINITTIKPEKFKGDLLIYFIPQDKGKNSPGINNLKKVAKLLSKMGDFTGKQGQSSLFYPQLLPGNGNNGFLCKRIMLVGIGKLEGDENGLLEQIRLAAGVAVRECHKLKVDVVMAVLPVLGGLSKSETAEALAEGLLLANYSFKKYQTKDKEEDKIKTVESFLIYGDASHSSLRKGVQRARVAADAACTARNMANEPGNYWTPAQFSEYGKKISDKYGLNVRVFSKSELKKLKMGGLLAVNQGSETPPRMVVIEYIKNRNKPVVLLVGKGLTFDSGGISLKPANGMEEMKYDMCGGAAVVSVMQAIGELQPENINVVAVIPATDNMPGGGSLKPGDVITHFNGKTSEIINTDAEGRLILADGLAYGIKRYKPEAVIDLATLTGAVIVGLGHHYTGLFSNNDRLAEAVISAGEKTGEPFWRLPLGKEYSKQIGSEIADIKNSGGREAGASTAAAYLEEFVGKVPWSHFDIAGTAWNFTEKSYIPKGPSGVGVRSLLRLLQDWQPLDK